jgi:hypothetical protein
MALIWLLLALLLCPCGGAEVAVFNGFTLIRNGAPQRDAGMIVTDGRIMWVGPAAQMKDSAGRNSPGFHREISRLDAGVRYGFGTDSGPLAHFAGWFSGRTRLPTSKIPARSNRFISPEIRFVDSRARYRSIRQM